MALNSTELGYQSKVMDFINTIVNQLLELPYPLKDRALQRIYAIEPNNHKYTKNTIDNNH
ncbi:hypothetical protein [Candidatus Enterovibrio escicola]|nr:hypothetical protein [Candidatus Enterovibrio escacola]